MADANAVDYSSMRLHTHLQSVLGDITDPGSPPPIDDRMDTWAEDGDGEQSENVRSNRSKRRCVSSPPHSTSQSMYGQRRTPRRSSRHLQSGANPSFFDYSSEEEAHPPSENMLQMALQQQQALLIQSQKALHVANQQIEELRQCNE